MVLRIRELPRPPLAVTKLGEADYINLGNGETKSNLDSPLILNQAMGEQRHSLCIDETHGRPPYQTGGPLFISHVDAPVYPTGYCSVVSKSGVLQPGPATYNFVEGDGSDWRSRYSGSFLLSTNNSLGWLAHTPVQKNQNEGLLNPDMSDLGSRAYNRLRPKPSKAGLFQTIVEGRDLPRTLKTTAQGFSTLWNSLGGRASGWKQLPSEVGNQYVNAQFGWKPFVKELKDTSHLILNFSSEVDKLKKSNGQWRRRRFTEDAVVNEQVIHSVVGGSNNFGCTPFMDSFLWVVPNSATFTITLQEMSRVWYEGVFAQYLPEFDDSLMSGHPAIAGVAQAIDLFGLNINPVNIYRVMPWTWCADWFVNIGDNIQSFQDLFNNQIASKYFYIMREAWRRLKYRITFTTYDGQTHDLNWFAGWNTKVRLVGESNFGFSLSPDGLSDAQLAIIGALGLGRLR